MLFELNAVQQNNLKIFLNRATLTALEVDAFNDVIACLNCPLVITTKEEEKAVETPVVEEPAVENVEENKEV